MKTILLVCQNLQEYYDWRRVLNELAQQTRFALKLLPTWELDLAKTDDLGLDSRIDVQSLPLGVDAGDIKIHFRRLPFVEKAKMLRKMAPFMTAALSGVDVICSGNHSAFARFIYSRKHPDQVFVTFIRALVMPLQEPRPRRWARATLNRLARPIGLDFLTQVAAEIDYSDRYFVIGEMNRRYLEHYGVSGETIEIIGPPALDPLAESSSQPQGDLDRPCRVCFLSQAFDYHHFHDEQEEQNRSIEEFIEARDANQHSPAVEVHVKLHPRDRPDRYRFLEHTDVAFHRQPMPIKETRDKFDVFVGGTSTLLFEMLAGSRPALFVAGKHLRHSYGQWFEQLGIEPLADGQTVYNAVKAMIQQPTSPRPTPQMKELARRVFSVSPTESAARRGAQALRAVLDGTG